MGLTPPPSRGTSSTSGLTRRSVTFTIEGGAGTIQLPASFVLLRVAATAAGRFRLYRSITTRDADKGRVVTQAIESAHGLLLESVHAPGALDLSLSPLVSGAASEKGAPCAWNWEGTVPITITLDLIQMESES